MLTARFVALLSATSVALSISPADLKVKLTAVHSSVDSIDDIVISAVISNPTSSDIRVFNKGNVLDTSATRSFAVTKDGEQASFTGIRATYDLTADALYTTIPAGSSVAVNHTDLASLYDFEALGTGTFTFEPNTIFQTSPDGSDAVEVEASSISVSVANDVAKREVIPGHLQKRLSTPSCSDSSKNQIIVDSISYARSLAGGAATDINTHPTSSEFTTYFGGNSQSDIWYRLDIIAGDLASSGTRKIYCNTDPAGLCYSGSGVIAYTLLYLSGGTIVGSDIYNCEIFFTSVGTTPSICTNGYDSTTSSRGGVILHELSHATSATNDIAYGCSNTAALSAANKRNNADNYRCMGLAIYKHYNC